jgi:hypothetical protein
MKRAKDQILNSFIFNFDTPGKVLREQETYEFYGYPHDFLEQYRAGVEKVTAEDVLRVANKYLHKDEMKVLVVGNSSEFEKELAVLGPVTPIDITIPPPPASKGETGKPMGSNAEGKAAIAKLTEALGGEAKVAAVKTVHQSITMLQQGQEMKIDQSIIYPDKQVQKMNLPQGELQVVTPDAAFAAMGKKVQDLPASQRAAEEAALKHDFVNVLQHSGDAKYVFAATGKEKLGDVEATVVDVDADGASTRWWIAPDGKLLREVYTELGRSGPVTMTMLYSDWKDFDGLEYPTKYELTGGEGEGAINMTLTAMEVNVAIDPKLMEKPQP